MRVTTPHESVWREGVGQGGCQLSVSAEVLLEGGFWNLSLLLPALPALVSAAAVRCRAIRNKIVQQWSCAPLCCAEECALWVCLGVGVGVGVGIKEERMLVTNTTACLRHPSGALLKSDSGDDADESLQTTTLALGCFNEVLPPNSV